jgi:hypothetical protein
VAVGVVSSETSAFSGSVLFVACPADDSTPEIRTYARLCNLLNRDLPEAGEVQRTRGTIVQRGRAHFLRLLNVCFPAGPD